MAGKHEQQLYTSETPPLLHLFMTITISVWIHQLSDHYLRMSNRFAILLTSRDFISGTLFTPFKSLLAFIASSVFENFFLDPPWNVDHMRVL